MGVVAYLVAVVVYNNAANRWSPFNGWAFVPMNALTTVAVLLVGVAGWGLNITEIGLGVDGRELLVGFGLGLLGTALLAGTALVPRGARWLIDERVAHLSGLRLAYQLLIRIPVGTAFLEEIAFRGVAFAALRTTMSDVQAAIVSSIAFGLWHIAPTLNLADANRPNASTRARGALVLGAVVFTFTAGLLLVWLRVETAGLGAPIALHATLNAGATVLSVTAYRRLELQTQSTTIRPTMPKL